MSVNLSPVAGVAGQFFDNNGVPLSGGKLYTYVSGTTTPQAAYTSALGTTAHSNPIILDAGGRVPGGEIWLTDGSQYKFVLYTSVNVLIGTWDNIIGINSNFVNYSVQEEIQTATAGQTVFTLATISYAPGTKTLQVFVDGVNQYDGSTYSYVETSSTVVTFTAGLHVGALVKFTTAVTLSAGATAADLVSYTPAGTGAVATTVQSKLRESVSVLDFSGDVGAMFSARTGLNTVFEGLGQTIALTSTLSYTLSAGVSWEIRNFNFTSTAIAEPAIETGVLNIAGDLVITAGVWAGTNRLTLTNVTFTDSRVALGTLGGAILHGFENLTLNQVRAKGYSNTGVLVGVSKNFIATTCDMSGNMYAGLRTGNLYSSVITGGNYSNNGVSAPTYGYGIAFSVGWDSTYTSLSRRVLIQGVMASGNLRKGIDVHCGIYVSLDNNTIVGFGYAGIGAVAEAASKNVEQVTITNNRIYGFANTLAGPCIEMGSYGVGAPYSGTWIVSGNILNGSQIATSSAILVASSATDLSPENVIITNNSITNGSSAGYPIIDVYNYSAVNLIKAIEISGNVLHSVATNKAINCYNVSNNISIKDNQITVDSGTVAEAISTRDNASVTVTIDGNTFLGAATYTRYLADVSTVGTSAQNNRTASGPLMDILPGGITTEYGTAAPVSVANFHRAGSRVINSGAASGSIGAWRCSVSGSPGTWITEFVLP